MRKVAVIGAGIGGIAAALRLRAKGYAVEVFEKNDRPGGKLMEHHEQGFRFDMGPSLFTMPEFVTELFDLFDCKPTDYFTYSKLDNTCNYYYPDESLIRGYSDHDKFLQELQQADRSAVTAYLDKAKKLFESTADLFLFNPFPTKQAFMSETGQQIGKTPGMLDAFTSLHNRNQRSFTDIRLVQLFDRYATYNGSNPWKTPATLKMIAHLEHNVGAFFPAGGMYDIVKSLVKLAEIQGVIFHLNVPVDQVEPAPHSQVMLTTQGRKQIFDLLINDVDVYTFYARILKKGRVPWSVKLQQRSTSALIFYWGVQKQFPELDVHNILFAGNYREEFKDLFSRKTIHRDPTIYIFVSSKIVPSDAPKGMENWFVMINTPEQIGQDWDQLIRNAREDILRKINHLIKADLSQLIGYEKMVDPREIESRTGSFRGSLYGTSSNNRLSAFLRHPNRKNKLPNMYFVGGSVHPGGGIPLCLASAKIIAKQIPNANDQTEEFAPGRS